VILSYGYWMLKFGGDRSVLGKTIEVDGKPRAIIGVLPESFHFLGQTNPAMILPMKLNREKSYLGSFLYGGIARLKPGVTLAQANADVARMLPIVDRSFPPPPGYGLKMFEDLRPAPNLQPLKQEVVGDVGKVLWVLMGGISLVLVIACANLANFLLVRAEGRRQELAIRAALGASRGRIAAQLFFFWRYSAVCLASDWLTGPCGSWSRWPPQACLASMKSALMVTSYCLRSQRRWPRDCFSVPSLFSSTRAQASESDCARAGVQ
jgi:hypothetical protein